MGLPSLHRSMGMSFGVALISTVIVGTLIMGSVSRPATSTVPADARSCDDFAREQSRGGPHDTDYNPEDNRLVVYQGSARYDLDLSAPACMNATGHMRKIIDLAIERYRTTNVAKCQAWSRFFAQGKTTMHGRAINPADVQTYMAEIC